MARALVSPGSTPRAGTTGSLVIHTFNFRGHCPEVLAHGWAMAPVVLPYSTSWSFSVSFYRSRWRTQSIHYKHSKCSRPNACNINPEPKPPLSPTRMEPHDTVEAKTALTVRPGTSTPHAPGRPEPRGLSDQRSGRNGGSLVGSFPCPWGVKAHRWLSSLPPRRKALQMGP